MQSDLEREELVGALDAAGVGAWAWDRASGAVRWSPGVERLYGLPPGGFGGTLDAFLACVHPDDRADVQARIQAALEAREGYTTEHRVALADGERWISGVGRVLVGEDGSPSGIRGIVVDITERRHRDRALAESEARYRLISERTSDYVYDAVILETGSPPPIVAGAFEATTGYTPEEVAAAGGWLALIVPEDRAAILEQLEMIQRGHPFVHEYRIVTRDGSVRWLRDRATPIVDPVSGKATRFVGAVQDVTEVKQLREQLLQAQKMEALARLAGSVAHDFNNLLTVVLGAVELIEPELPEPLRHLRYTDEIRDALERARELTRSLLTFGRHDVSLAKLVDLSAEVASVKPLLARAAGERAQLTVEAENVVAPVLVDPGQLRLALLNLVVNARDAIDGRGTIRVRCTIETLREDSRERPPELAPGRVARIEVIDDGEGISPEHLPRLFEPYFTSKPEGRGTGLGLAIVYGVARKHGGTISVRSEPGKGSTFTLRLPLAGGELASPGALPVQRVSFGGNDHVLWVDDDPGVRRMVERILRSHNYIVHAFSSGEEALALADEALREMALLLSDVRLGGMDGVTLATKLRERHPSLAVVLVSGHAGEDRHAEIRAHGYRFVPKPFTAAGLTVALREALDESVGASP